MTESTFVLSAEPLLEQIGSPLRDRPVDAEAAAFLQRILDAPDAETRGAQAYATLQKGLSSDVFVQLLRSLLGAAARGEEAGVLGLATLMHIRAPGEAVLGAVREFAHLHRMAGRLFRATLQGQDLEDEERQLLDDLTRLDDTLSHGIGAPTLDQGALPHPRDLGHAGCCRRAFARIEKALQEQGSLSDDMMAHFLKLADLELRAAALRASTLAGAIDPESTRHVTQVVPLLSNLDAENRELRDFLRTLSEERRSSLFFEQTSALRHHLIREDSDAFLLRCAEAEELQVLRRMFAAIERRPLATRLLGYFVDRLYKLGDELVANRLRKQPIDLVEALLIACEFADGNQLLLPAGERVRGVVAQSQLAGTAVVGERVVVEVVPDLLRRLVLPLGLPRYHGPDGVIEEAGYRSLRDLIMDNLNNTSVLLGFLKNQKIVSTPGIVALVVQRCRSMAVMEVVCNTRHLHSGYANKEVPLELLKTPMRISIKTLRRFVNVRYISKVDLRRLAVDRSSVRREVSEEVERYLKSLN